MVLGHPAPCLPTCRLQQPDRVPVTIPWPESFQPQVPSPEIMREKEEEEEEYEEEEEEEEAAHGGSNSRTIPLWTLLGLCVFQNAGHPGCREGKEHRNMLEPVSSGTELYPPVSKLF